MAIIAIDVKLNSKAAVADIKAIAEQFDILAKTLKKATVNTDLTQQLRAAAELYKQLGVAASKSMEAVERGAEAAKKAAIADEKLARAKEQTSAASARAKLAEARLTAALEKEDARKKKLAADEERRRQKAADSAERAAERIVKAAEAEAEAEARAEEKAGKAADILRKRYADLIRTMGDLSKKYPTNTFEAHVATLTESRANLDSLIAAYHDGKVSLDDFAAGLSELDGKFKKTSADIAVTRQATQQLGNTAVSTGDRIGTLVVKVGKWMVATTLVYAPIRALREGLRDLVSILQETEDAVIELRRVLNEDIDYGHTTADLYNLTSKYGQTIENTIEATKAFAKTGMNYSEATEAAEAALLAMNVAELNVTESTDGLIAVMKQFNFEASDLEHIVDVLNITADNAAVTTKKLMEALQRAGSYARSAGLSLEETVGIITALSEATGQSGRRIGTAMRSLVSYTTKDTALETFSALSPDMDYLIQEYRRGAKSIIEVWSGLSDEMKHLTSEQADMLDAYFNTAEGSRLREALGAELGEVYDQLTGIYDTAGVYRKNYFIALMNNMDQVEETLETIRGAEGYSQAENDKYLESFTAKHNEMVASWQKLAAQEGGVLDIMKGLADAATVLARILNGAGGVVNGVSTLFSVLLLIGHSGIGKSLSELWFSFKKTGVSAAQATLSIRALGEQLRQTISAEERLALQSELLAARQARLAASIAGVTRALSLIMLAINLVNMAVGAWKASQERRRQADEEALRQTNELIRASAKKVDAYKKEMTVIDGYIAKVKDLYSVINNEAAAEKDVANAKKEIVSIQKELNETVGESAKQIDLQNGKIDEQIARLRALSDAQVQTYAEKIYMENSAAYNKARETLRATGATGIISDKDFSYDYSPSKNPFKNFARRHGFQGTPTTEATRDMESWRKLLQGAQASGITAGMTSTINWTIEGTTEEKIRELERVRDYVFRNASEVAGLTEEETTKFVGLLSQRINALETDVYKNSKEVIENYGAVFDYMEHRISFEEYRRKFLGAAKEFGVESKKVADKIAALADDALKAVIDRLKEARDITKDTLSLEEKKLAVEEARAALHKAENERTVRVLNAETGQWEFRPDEGAIFSAKEKLNDAIEALNKYIGDQAWDGVIKELGTGNATTASVQAILEQWKKEYTEYNDGEPPWLSAIKKVLAEVEIEVPDELIKKTDGDEERMEVPSSSSSSGAPYNTADARTRFARNKVLQLMQRQYGEVLAPYDRGGLLNGTGGIKATERTESVNDPEITSRILSPTSNSAFSAFSRSLGLLFGVADKVAARGEIRAVNGRGGAMTDSHDTVYSLNGVQISAAVADEYTLGDIFRLLPLAREL